VLLHVLHYLEKEERYHPDIIAFLQPTSPFRTHEHINAGLRMLLASDVDSVMGVCEVEADSHPYYVYERDEEGNLKELIRGRNKPLRRQELPKLFRMSDGLIIMRRRYFDKVGENSPCFNPNSMKGLVMDKISSIGIDDEFDFLLAEFVVKSGLFRSGVKV
jgi:CMP-N-acetylneuraminic acid synthetase